MTCFGPFVNVPSHVLRGKKAGTCWVLRSDGCCRRDRNSIHVVALGSTCPPIAVGKRGAEGRRAPASDGLRQVRHPILWQPRRKNKCARVVYGMMWSVSYIFPVSYAAVL